MNLVPTYRRVGVTSDFNAPHANRSPTQEDRFLVHWQADGEYSHLMEHCANANADDLMLPDLMLPAASGGCPDNAGVAGGGSGGGGGER